MVSEFVTKIGYTVPVATEVIVGGPTPRLTVENDPLGPVNKIVTLWVGERRIRTVLTPVHTGSTVRLSYDAGTPLIRYWGPTWEELNGIPGIEHEPYRPASWCVEVDGKRVIKVPVAECQPPRPPAPRVPLRTRAGRVIRKRWRATTDAIATRLGYHREGECGGDDW